MSSHRIVCVDTERPHRHIVSVGIGTDPKEATEKLTVSQVRSALDKGDRFYTVSPSTKEEADVRADDCKINGCA